MTPLRPNHRNGVHLQAPGLAARSRRRHLTLVTRSQVDNPRERRLKVAQKLGCTALTAALAVYLTGTSLYALPATADSVYEKRQADMQKRKELLQQAREKALAKGGVAEGQDPSTASTLAATEESEKVKEATAGVEKGNKAREAEAAQMRESLKKNIKSYDTSSKQSRSVLKPGADAPENPSWFSKFIENKQKETEAKNGAPEADIQPQSSSQPSIGEVLKPQVPGKEADKAIPANAVKPVPEPNPAPSLGFAKPKEEEKPDTTPAPPPTPKLEPKFTQPEPKSTPPPASTKPVPPPTKAQPPPPQTSPVPAKPAPIAARPDPKPQPAPPAVPAAKKPGVRPVQPAVKKAQEKQDSKRGKRKGPLPASVVQLSLLALSGGLGYLSFFQEEKTNAVLAAAAKSIADLYNKLEGAVKKQTKKA